MCVVLFNFAFFIRFFARHVAVHVIYFTAVDFLSTSSSCATSFLNGSIVQAMNLLHSLFASSIGNSGESA